MGILSWMVRSAESGGPIPQHNARFDQAGAWPAATQAWQTHAMLPWQPSAAPPGWYAGNVPASGHYIPIPVYYLNSRRTLQARLQPQIGPYDDSTARANALQTALAQTYAALSGQG